jgi:hypothetical protein
MKLQIGELYYHNIQGICVITELHEPEETSYSHYGRKIGRYESLARKHVFLLYEKMVFTLATDNDILEFLNSRMGRFNLSEFSDASVSIGEDYIILGQGEESVFLAAESAKTLKNLLNKELV